MKKLIACLAVALTWGTAGAAHAADRRCPKDPGKIRLEGVLHVSKDLKCIGAALMADDLQRKLNDAYPDFPSRATIWAHGTGTADTPKQSRYRCTITSRTANEALQLEVKAICRNKSHDRWTYRMLF